MMFLMHASLFCLICVAARGFSISNPTNNKHVLVMKRPDDFKKRESTRTKECAFILFPGCHLKPEDYTQLASSIQQKSSAWVHIPKLPFNMATPWTINECLVRAIHDLEDAGFTGKDIIVGGHSLGATFLQKAVTSFNSKVTTTTVSPTIKGIVYLACFKARGITSELPCLTVSGDLDGLIRVSRIAEDCYNNVVKIGDTAAARLNHAIVLVPGMNHNLFTSSGPTMMESLMDLKQEISGEQAVESVSSTISSFIRYQLHHEEDSMMHLNERVDVTRSFLQPLIDALLLEGNYHLASPCYECEADDSCSVDPSSSCSEGSRWIEELQYRLPLTRKISASLDSVRDEFRQSWWINPFADPPFYHPTVSKLAHNSKVRIETVTEAVYDKLGYIFDGGLVSNTALELRTKMNSPEAILESLGMDSMDPAAFSKGNPCSSLNQETIQWAFENAPPVVRERYVSRGKQLTVGSDIHHNAGPSWIWTSLNFGKHQECGLENECVVIDSHTMATPLDHPVPFAGGKLYCKILSAARVLDFMYTDALR